MPPQVQDQRKLSLFDLEQEPQRLDPHFGMLWSLRWVLCFVEVLLIARVVAVRKQYQLTHPSAQLVVVWCLSVGSFLEGA